MIFDCNVSLARDKLQNMHNELVQRWNRTFRASVGTLEHESNRETEFRYIAAMKTTLTHTYFLIQNIYKI